jgi:hypothetical protein
MFHSTPDLPPLNIPVLDAYLTAFRERDVARCMESYADGAVLEFGVMYFRDRASVEKWHRERFAANLALVRIDKASVNGDVVTADGAVSSDRLRKFGLSTLPVRATFHIRDGKITEARFGLKT